MIRGSAVPKGLIGVSTSMDNNYDLVVSAGVLNTIPRVHVWHHLLLSAFRLSTNTVPCGSGAATRLHRRGLRENFGLGGGVKTTGHNHFIT